MDISHYLFLSSVLTLIFEKRKNYAFKLAFDPFFFFFFFRITKFDLSSPAVSRGLPLTLVICRTALQDILLNAVGLDIVRNKSKVVDFLEDPSKVELIFD
ncbi:unnamed protein product [Prunus armeniaca]